MDNTMFWAIVVGMILALLLIYISQLRNDISNIKKTMDKIAKQVGVPDVITEEVKNQLKGLINENKKVKAVKQYRIITGSGLKEANDYVESLAATVSKYKKKKN